MGKLKRERPEKKKGSFMPAFLLQPGIVVFLAIIFNGLFVTLLTIVPPQGQPSVLFMIVSGTLFNILYLFYVVAHNIREKIDEVNERLSTKIDRLLDCVKDENDENDLKNLSEELRKDNQIIKSRLTKIITALDIPTAPKKTP